MTYVSENYDGGEEPSPFKGQSKAQAWCACLFQKVPDFADDLAHYLKTRNGKNVDDACNTYADWD